MMHPAQKQSVIAMIVAIKAQLDAICHIVGFDDAMKAGGPAVIPKSTNQEYLEEKEENEIEKASEEARESLMSEAEAHKKAWAEQRKAIREESFL